MRAVVGAGQLLAGQLVEAEGEALREAPAVGEDDRAAMGPDELQDARVDGRPDARCGPPARRPAAGRLLERDRPRRAGPCPPRAPRPGAPAACARRRPRWSPAAAGHLRRPAARGPAAGRPGRPPRPTAVAASRTGRCAAAAARVSASSRSSESARCAPRLVPARAWISSTMTQRTPRSASRACEVRMQVERLRRGDEDVRRPLAEGAPLVGRGVARAHAHAHRPRRLPSRSAASAMPASGARRLRSTSWTSALSGETYSTRRRASGPSGRLSTSSRSRHHRKAASVLPLPVGAQMSVCSPPRWPASPAPVPPWAPRRSRGTTRAWQPRRLPAGHGA